MADDAPETQTGGTARPSRFAALPPRVPLEDLVEETDASTPPDEPTSDPNRDVANRWGFGMVGF
jgi:hypothetical protein